MRCEEGCGPPRSWETEAGTRCAVPTGHRHPCIGTRAVNAFLLAGFGVGTGCSRRRAQREPGGPAQSGVGRDVGARLFRARLRRVANVPSLEFSRGLLAALSAAIEKFLTNRKLSRKTRFHLLSRRPPWEDTDLYHLKHWSDVGDRPKRASVAAPASWGTLACTRVGILIVFFLSLNAFKGFTSRRDATAGREGTGSQMVCC